MEISCSRVIEKLEGFSKAAGDKTRERMRKTFPRARARALICDIYVCTYVEEKIASEGRESSSKDPAGAAATV